MSVQEELVVLVNEQDVPVGMIPKLEAHQKGLLHRAFSVFIFNNNKELLLQRRALEKYHSPGLWTNTCCSHQRPNESTLDAAHRRLKEEMGFDCELEVVSSFVYKTPFDNGLTEHEYDYVLIGLYNDVFSFNKDEVAEYEYKSLDLIKKEIQSQPNKFTSWFKIAIDTIDFQNLMTK
ncbi:MAG: isopentenyl-diphosphate Delta-isomerase [Cyclobacteriaceae bacterium]